MVHLIFVARYRKKLFYGEFRNDIKQYIFDTCKTHHWYIRRMETDKDYIHILLQYNPTDSITQIVSTLKQVSAYYAWKKYHRLYRNNIGKSILCGQTDILRRLSGRYLQKRSNTILKIRAEIVKPTLKGRGFHRLKDFYEHAFIIGCEDSDPRCHKRYRHYCFENDQG